MTGAVLYGLTYSQVFPKISALADYGSVVLPDLWNLNPFLVVLLFGLISVFLFYLIDRSGFHRKKQIQN